MSVRCIVWLGLVAVAQMVSCLEIRKFSVKQNSWGGLGQNVRFSSIRKNHGISGQACREKVPKSNNYS